MRKIVVALGSLLLLSSLALAQIPTSGNVFFGYSYQNSDVGVPNRTSMNGWEATVEGKFLPFIGIAADFSSYYGTPNFPIAVPVAVPVCTLPPCPVPTPVNFSTSEQNYLFGPRVSISVSKFRPFAEALFGAGHINAHSAGSDTSFATAIGGGFDYKLLKIVAWRFQGDYLRTSFFSSTQDNVRLTTGIVVRF
jgi:hypothetical protein